MTLIKENFYMIICFIVSAVLYYNFYLAPRDAMLMQTMECMEDLHSTAEYKRCSKLARSTK